MRGKWLCLFASLYATGVSAQDLILEGTVFDTVAARHGLDPLLLYSVALTESVTAVGDGGIQPYPYVFRTLDGAHYFADREAAETALRSVLTRTRNVDVGMMQVNLRHHPQRDPLRLLDVQHNLDIAARILKSTLASSPDPVIGVGRYHSWRHEYTAWYGQRVWQTYRNLGGHY